MHFDMQQSHSQPYRKIPNIHSQDVRGRKLFQNVNVICLLLLVLSYTVPGVCSDPCVPCSAPQCTCSVDPHDTDFCVVECDVGLEPISGDGLPEGELISALSFSDVFMTEESVTAITHFIDTCTYLKTLKLLGYETLHEAVLENLPASATVSLHENSWRCDCDLLWLKTWIISNPAKVSSGHRIECLEPSEVSCQDITTVPDRQFTCASEVGALAVLAREKRTSDCYDKLLQRQEVYGNCAPSDYASCYSTDSTTAVYVLFSAANNVNSDAECRTDCSDRGAAYCLPYAVGSVTVCFWGDVTDACTDCQDTDFTAWSDGDDMCSGVQYLPGVSLTASALTTAASAPTTAAPDSWVATVTALTPYSTNCTSTLSVTRTAITDSSRNSVSDSLSSGESSACYFSLGDGRKDIYSASGSVDQWYLLPGWYDVGFTAEWSSDSVGVNATKTLPVKVLDPPVFTENLESIVPSDTYVYAVLQQGTDLQVTWTRTNGTQHTATGKYCETGWFQFRDKCLKSVTDATLSYDDANQSCTDQGSNLVTLADELETEELATVLTFTNSEEYFLGVKKVSGVYVWQASQTTAYFTPATVTSSQVCVVLQEGGGLRGRRCNTEHHTLCQKAPVDCPNGGSYDATWNRCYVVETTGMLGWAEARDVCSGSYGGTLAIVSSREEQATLEALLADQVVDVWLGLSDNSSEGYYLWPDGASLSAYTNWGPDQPHDADSSANCVVATYAEGWQWADQVCSTSTGYVCQYHYGETLSVPKLYAGTVVSTVDRALTELPEATASGAQEATKLYLFNSWGFSSAGYLHSWLFEAQAQLTATEMHLQVYRPQGINAFLQVVYAGCESSPISTIAFTYNQCHSETECVTGEQYCPLTQACQPLATPCTCAYHSGLPVCQQEVAFENIPNMELVSETVVNLDAGSEGLFRVQFEENFPEVQLGDIIGIEIPASSVLPVVCEVRTGVEGYWAGTYFTLAQASWLALGSVNEFTNAATTHHMVCELMAVYTSPRVLQPPQNIAHYSLSDYDSDTFVVNVENSLETKSSQAVVNGKELSDFQLIYPCTTNSTWVIEQSVSTDFIFAINSRESGIQVSAIIYGQTVVATVTADCPDAIADLCVGYDELEYQFATGTFMSETEFSNDSVIVRASKGNAELSINFTLSVQTGITGAQIVTGGTWVFSGESVNATVDIVATNASSASIRYEWVMGDTPILGSANAISFSRTDAGQYTLQVTVYNEINNVSVNTVFYVCNGLTVLSQSDLVLTVPQTATNGASVNVTSTALLLPYTVAYLRFNDAGDVELGTLLCTNFLSASAICMVSFEFTFTTAGENSVTVSALNAQNNQTLQTKTETTQVINTITSVTVLSGLEDSTQSDTHSFSVTLGFTEVEFSASPVPENDTGAVSYSYDFGDETTQQDTASGVATHAFNSTSPASYNVTVTATNSIGAASVTIEVTFIHVAVNLSLSVPTYVFIYEDVTVTAYLVQGGDVTYVLDDGNPLTDLIIQFSPEFALVYNMSGEYTLNLTASNEISAASTYKTLTVYELSYYVIYNNLIAADYMAKDQVSYLRVNMLYHNTDLLTFTWDTGDGTTFTTNQTGLSHTFTGVGEYNVTVLISSDADAEYPVNTTQLYKTVSVQEALTGMVFSSNASILSIYHGGVSDNVLLNVSLETGTNFTMTWSYTNISHETAGELALIAEFFQCGLFNINVEACNGIGCVSQGLEIKVYEVIEGLYVDFNGVNITASTSDVFYIAADEQIDMYIYVTAGCNLTYNWNISDADHPSTVYNTDTVAWLHHSSGLTANSYIFIAEVSNPISSQSIRKTLTLQDVVAGLVIEAAETAEYYLVGDTLELTTSRTSGSSVEYVWHIQLPNGTVQQFDEGQANTLRLSLALLGEYSATVTGSNQVSDLTSERFNFTVKEAISGQIRVNSTDGETSVLTHTTLEFTARLEASLSSPSYAWQISTDGADNLTETSTDLTHTFNTAGTYQVSVTITEDYYIGIFNLSLSVLPSVTSLNVTFVGVAGDTVTVDQAFHIILELGAEEPGEAEVAFTIDLGSGEDILRLTQPGNVSVSYATPGTYTVNISASNAVSMVSQVYTLHVLARVTGVQLQDCCDDTLTVGTQYHFSVTTDTGEGVTYTWTLGGDSPVTLTGDTVTHTFTEAGNFSLDVTATDGYSSDTVSQVVRVLDEIRSVTLTADQPLLWLYYYDAPGLNITFLAEVTGGQGGAVWLRFSVNDTVVQRGTEAVFTHLFSGGYYVVRVEAYNTVSQQQDSKIFQVQELGCAPPELELSGALWREEFKSQPVKVEVKVNNYCLRYQTEHEWKVYRLSDMASDSDLGCDHEDSTPEPLPHSVATTSPTLTIPAQTLAYGDYCMRMKSVYLRTPAVTTQDVRVKILSSSLQAIIAGGSQRTLSMNTTILFVGSDSYDPDLQTQIGSDLTYHWNCTSQSAAFLGRTFDMTVAASGVSGDWGCFPDTGEETVRVAENSWFPERVYTITLIVSEGHRDAGTTVQKVRVTSESVVAVAIDCLSCRELNHYTVSNSQHVKFEGTCPDCRFPTSYRWNVTFIRSDGFLEEVPLDRGDTTSTGAEGLTLAINAGVLRDDQAYNFTFAVWTTVDGVESAGRSSMELGASTLPRDGNCTITLPNATRVMALVDEIVVHCDNWTDDGLSSSQLIYHTYVEIVNPINNTVEWYPVYRGTRHTITFYLASEKMVDNVTIHVAVIDRNDAKVQALARSVIVIATQASGNESRTDTLVTLAVANLQILSKGNDPKAILQYVIPLILQLNAEAALNDSPQDDIDARKALKAEVLHVLNDTSVVSAIDDIQQTAYVLGLCTRYILEFPGDIESVEITLYLLGVIIDRLKSQVSPGMTGDEFMPTHILSSTANVIQILQIRMSDPSYEPTAKDKGVLISAYDIIKDTMFLILQTQVTGESPTHYTQHGGVTALAQRVKGKDIEREYSDGVNSVRLPVGLVDMNQVVFQLAITYPHNLMFWASDTTVDVGSYLMDIIIGNTTGSPIPLANLEHPVEMQVTQQRDTGQQSSPGTARRRKRRDTGSTTGAPVHLQAGAVMFAVVNVTDTLPEVSALHLKFAGQVDNASSPQADITVLALLDKGRAPTWGQHRDNLTINIGPNGTAGATGFFVIDDFNSGAAEDQYYVTVINNNTFSVTLETEHYLSACQFYNVSSERWDTSGCTVTVASTTDFTVCECNHLTLFGTSVLDTPNTLNFQDLYLTSAVSPLVYVLLSVTGFLYVLLALLSWRLDTGDAANIRSVPLCGKEGLYKYEITVVTGRRSGAGTSANVGIRLFGENAQSRYCHLQKADAFQANCTDTMLAASDSHLGRLKHIVIWHDNTGLSPAWYLSRVTVRDLEKEERYVFLVNDWLTVDAGGDTKRQVQPADNEAMSKYSLLLAEELSKGVVDGHLWVSVFQKPARALFSRVQRLTCVVTMACMYMATNVLWFYSISGGDSSTHITGSDAIVGVLTACVVIPVVVLLIQVFRHCLPAAPPDDLHTRKLSTAETIEMEDLARDRPSRGFRQPSAGIIRIPSDLTNETLDSSTAGGRPARQPAPLRRTDRIHQVAPMPKHSVKLPDHSHSGKGGKMWSDENILAWSGGGEARHSSTERSPPDSRHPRPTTALLRREDSAESHSSSRQHSGNSGNSGSSSSWMNSTGSRGGADTGRDSRLDFGGLSRQPSSNESSSGGGGGKPSETDLLYHQVPGPSDGSRRRAGGQGHKPRPVLHSRIRSSKHTVSVIDDASNLISEMDEFDESINRPDTRKASAMSQNSVASGEFDPRGDTSLFNLSLGSVCSYGPTRENTFTTVYSSATNRTRYNSHNDSEGPLSDIQENEPIAGGLAPAYAIPTHTILTDEDDSLSGYIDLLKLPPPTARHCHIPHFCVYICYSLCALVSLTSMAVLFAYGRGLSPELALRWVLACGVSVAASILVVEPLRLVTWALIMAKVCGSIERCEYSLVIPPVIESNEKIQDIRIAPLAGISLVRAQRDGEKLRRVRVLMRQLIFYTGLILVVLVINYASLKSGPYYSKTHIEATFLDTPYGGRTFRHIRDFPGYWGWLEGVVAPGVHRWDRDTEAADGVRLGQARLRQVRSRPEGGCIAEDYLRDRNADYVLPDPCYGNPSWSEDKMDYNALWEIFTTGNTSEWGYSDNREDKQPGDYNGYTSVYGAGGYNIYLGDSYTETYDIIETLKNNSWLDRATRAVFLEFTEHIAGTSLFSSVTILVEFPISGSAIPWHRVSSFELLSYVGDVSVYVLCEGVLGLILLYFTVITVTGVRGEGAGWGRHLWNWVQLLITGLIGTGLCLYVHLVVYCKQVYSGYLSDKAGFTHFAGAAHWVSVWQSVNAVLLFVLMFKILHQLRFIRFMTRFTRTLNLAKGKLLALGGLFIAWLAIYAQVGYLWFGHLFYFLRSVGAGVTGMLGILRGNASHRQLDEMWMHDAGFTFFFIVSFLVVMFIYIFGLTLAVIQDSYRQAKTQLYYHSTLETQDYEMVDFMLDRFKQIIGVKKQKPAFRRVRFPNHPALSSRSSSAKTHGGCGGSSGSSDYSVVDEELAQMYSEGLVARAAITWETMCKKLDKVISVDEVETDLLHEIEHRLQTPPIHSPSPAKPKLALKLPPEWLYNAMPRQPGGEGKPPVSPLFPFLSGRHRKLAQVDAPFTEERTIKGKPVYVRQSVSEPSSPVKSSPRHQQPTKSFLSKTPGSAGKPPRDDTSPGKPPRDDTSPGTSRLTTTVHVRNYLQLLPSAPVGGGVSVSTRAVHRPELHLTAPAAGSTGQVAGKRNQVAPAGVDILTQPTLLKSRCRSSVGRAIKPDIRRNSIGVAEVSRGKPLLGPVGTPRGPGGKPRAGPGRVTPIVAYGAEVSRLRSSSEESVSLRYENEFENNRKRKRSKSETRLRRGGSGNVLARREQAAAQGGGAQGEVTMVLSARTKDIWNV